VAASEQHRLLRPSGSRTMDTLAASGRGARPRRHGARRAPRRAALPAPAARGRNDPAPTEARPPAWRRLGGRRGTRPGAMGPSVRDATLADELRSRGRSLRRERWSWQRSSPRRSRAPCRRVLHLDPEARNVVHRPGPGRAEQAVLLDAATPTLGASRRPDDWSLALSTAAYIRPRRPAAESRARARTSTRWAPALPVHLGRLPCLGLPPRR